MIINCFVCKRDVVKDNYYAHIRVEHSRAKHSHLIRVEANAIKHGRRIEQLRIIKLLEEQLCSCTLAECQVAQAIALIRGEK